MIKTERMIEAPLTPPVHSHDIRGSLRYAMPQQSVTSHPYDGDDGPYLYSEHTSMHGSPAVTYQELASRLPAEHYVPSPYGHHYADADEGGHMGLGIDMVGKAQQYSMKEAGLQGIAGWLRGTRPCIF